MNTDRIEKKILLRASRSRVWRALTDSKEFGEWFGVKFDEPFTPNKPLRGTLMPTFVDEEVAKRQKPYEGKQFDIVVAQIEPERLFSFRWHPYAVDPAVDYSSEPTTLIEFVLEDAAGGTMLTVTESGFDAIPIERRAQAFEMNSQGWGMQMRLIEKYLAHDVRVAGQG
ncbi:MAG TPA: SRPBCC family protein [Bryobacteraceae bacterium]|nr:SRPBCC family protein [Bryobacteraceae bacterium]